MPKQRFVESGEGLDIDAPKIDAICDTVEAIAKRVDALCAARADAHPFERHGYVWRHNGQAAKIGDTVELKGEKWRVADIRRDEVKLLHTDNVRGLAVHPKDIGLQIAEGRKDSDDPAQKKIDTYIAEAQ